MFFCDEDYGAWWRDKRGAEDDEAIVEVGAPDLAGLPLPLRATAAALTETPRTRLSGSRRDGVRLTSIWA